MLFGANLCDLEGVDLLHQDVTGDVLEADVVQETPHLLPDGIQESEYGTNTFLEKKTF